MRFHTGLAVLCLSAGLGAKAFGQAATNAPAPATLTPEAEQRARDVLNQTLRSNAPPTQATTSKSQVQEREAARKRVEADARRRFDEKTNARPASVATTPAPATQTTERDRELQRIESEVEKAKKRREQQTTPSTPTPAPAPKAPASSPAIPTAAEAAPPPATLPPDVEAKVRELLNQKTAELQAKTPAPPVAPANPPPAAATATPPPQVVVPTPAPAPTVAVTAPVAAPTTKSVPTLTPEQEAAARELLNRRPEGGPTPAKPAVVTTPRPTASPVVAPSPTLPAPAVAETTHAPAPGPKPTLTADQEAAAREMLNQANAALSGVRTPTTGSQPIYSAPPPRVSTSPAPATPSVTTTTRPTTTPAPIAPPVTATTQPAVTLGPAAPPVTTTTQPFIAPVPTPAPQPPPVAAVPMPQPQPVITPRPAPAAQLTPPAAPQLSADQEGKALAALSQSAPQLYGAVRTASPPEAIGGRTAPQNGTAASESNKKPARAEEPKVDSKKSRPVETVAPVESGGPRNKAQRLADLLAAYKADKITPLEYHTERAKILADPNP